MKKLLLIMLLAISVALSGCSSNDNKEVGNVEPEQESSTIDNEEEEDLQAEDEEESQDTEKAKKDKLEETAKEIEKEILEKTEQTKEEAPSKDKPDKEEIDPIEEKDNALNIQGKVNNPISLNLDDLKAMNDIIFKGNFYSLNNFGTRAYTEFKGVNLWSLLKSKAEISDEATKVKIIASDGYEMEFTVDQVQRQDYIDETDDTAKFPMIIAWEENGEEYDLDDGLPFKLVIGQNQPGDINKPQWVSNVEKIVVE